MNTAVVFIIFRRPEATRRVWERIRAARPRQLFVIADGGRNADEWRKCNAARELVAEVDWPCAVHRNYADINLGCRERVFSGLDWVFAQVEEAIILEDDCLPDPTFFRFCEELLARYRDDARVMTIGGHNFQQGRRYGSTSYYFTAYAYIWGWATWRRAWRLCDKQMSGWPAFMSTGRIGHYFPTPEERSHWTAILDRAYHGEWAWGHRWWFTQLAHAACGICPQVNLVENIGFGDDSTHTGITSAGVLPLKAQAISLPLRHAEVVTPCRKADLAYFRQCTQYRPQAGITSLAIIRGILRIPILHACYNWLRSLEWWKRLRNREYRRIQRERRRLLRLPRNEWSATALLGAPLRINDNLSFLARYEDIFERGIYALPETLLRPRILDVGANVGLAAIYFKRRHPLARITAFEADPEIAEALRGNLTNHGCTDVEIVAKAVATEAGVMPFCSLGGGSGRLQRQHDGCQQGQHVPTVRLRDYLGEQVDFLKLDIEGAELPVLLDCRDLLGNVRMAFIEYHSFAGEPQVLDELLALLRDSGFRILLDTAVRYNFPYLTRYNRDGMDLLVHLYAMRTEGA
jgi:FkbM family methyltransferase